MRITKREVLDILAVNDNLDTSVSIILKKIKKNQNDLSFNDLKRLKQSLYALKNKSKELRKSKNRHLERNKEWLDSDFLINFDNAYKNSSGQQKLQKSGRPAICFENKSERSVRRELAAISTNLEHDPKRILLACRYASRHSGNVELCSVLSACQPRIS